MPDMEGDGGDAAATAVASPPTAAAPTADASDRSPAVSGTGSTAAWATSSILLDGEVIRTEEEEALPDDEVVRRALSSYEPMERSVYLDEALRRVKRGHVMACSCEYKPGDPLSKACGEECLNRMSFVECSPKRCPCGRFCTNRRLQNKEYAAVEVFRTPGKGCGLRTLVDLPKGSLVMEYCGEVVSLARFRERIAKYAAKGMRHFYFMTLEADTVIDATRKGAISRFINHSCGPNCETQKWIVDGVQRIGIFTKQDVRKGEELTFDYKFKWFPGAKVQRCHCDSPKCKGYIGDVAKDADGNPIVADESVGTLADAPLTAGPERGANAAATDNANDDAALSGDEAEAPSDVDDGDELLPRSKGLTDADAVKALIDKLLNSVNQDTLIYSLHQLEITSKTDLLRILVAQDGVKILKTAVGHHASNPMVAVAFLRVLAKLPSITKTLLEETKLEAFLNKLVAQHNGDEVIRSLVIKQLAAWDAVHNAYKIRKRVQDGDLDGSPGMDRPDTPGAAHNSPAPGSASTPRAGAMPLYAERPASAGPNGSAAASPSLLAIPMIGQLDRYQTGHGAYGAAPKPSTPNLKRSFQSGPVASQSPRGSEADDDVTAQQRKRAALDDGGRRSASPAPVWVGRDSPAAGGAAPLVSWDMSPRNAAAADVPPPPPAPVLPPGWVATTDPQGNTYYFHEVTRVTQWDYPAEPAAPAPPVEWPAAPADVPALAASSRSGDSEQLAAFHSALAKLVVHTMAKWKHDLDVDVYKQTARKLTHAIEEKELKAGGVPIMTKDVEKKATKYVIKHMTENLEVYKRASVRSASKPSNEKKPGSGSSSKHGSSGGKASSSHHHHKSSRSHHHSSSSSHRRSSGSASSGAVATEAPAPAPANGAAAATGAAELATAS